MVKKETEVVMMVGLLRLGILWRKPLDFEWHMKSPIKARTA